MEAAQLIYVSIDKKHEAIIEDQNRCCLCGTDLKFKHTVDYITLRIEEKSNCPSCQIDLKEKEFTLQ